MMARVEVLSWPPHGPRAFLYHNFLTPEECAHIMATAKPLVHLQTLSFCTCNCTGMHAPLEEYCTYRLSV